MQEVDCFQTFAVTCADCHALTVKVYVTMNHEVVMECMACGNAETQY